MNKPLYAVTQGVPVDDVARNDEERDFYPSMVRSKELADSHSLGLTGINE